MNRLYNIIILGALFMGLAACGSDAATEEAPAEDDAAVEAGGELTLDQLMNATYSGIYTEPVTLVDGVYEGEPFVEGGASRPTVMLVVDSVIYGDLNGDGVPDASVLLVEDSGGSGVLTYVGAQLNQDGQPVDAGTVWMGDRIQIISGAIADQAVSIEMVTQGPDDPQCCATLIVQNSYALQDALLAESGSEEAGTVSLESLMGTSWVLLSLNTDVPVLADAPITADFADDQVSGSGGCNNYNAGVSSEGGQTIKFGDASSTLMACPEETSNQEFAYLTALEQAFQWSYDVGKLAILYMDADSNVGTLRFDPASALAGD